MKEIKIGNQIWSAENLAFTKDRDGNDLVLGKDYFYPVDIHYIADKFGLLYTWDAAKRVVPKGWHLPLKEEFEQLIKDLPIEEFASKREWPANCKLATKEDTLFSALPAGYHDEFFHYFGNYAYFWSATPFYDSGYAYGMFLHCNSKFSYLTYYRHYFSFSIRCVKD